MTYFFRSFLITAGVIFSVAVLRTPLRAQGLGTFSAFRISVIAEEDSDAPTRITSSSADIDLKNNIITLIDNVKVNDGQSEISCNKMEIYLDEDAAGALVGEAEKPADPGSAAENAETRDSDSAETGDDSEDEDEDAKNIRKIVCIGDVIFRKMADKDDPDGQDQIAVSGNAEFDVRKEIVVMTGAHSDPAGVLPENVYQSMEKHVRGNIIANHPVMMQGETWVIGERFTVFIRENNRLKVKDMKFRYTGTSLFEADPGKEETENGKTATDALISTRDADIDLENNRITLVGDVDVDEESNKITCNKMVIELKEKKPDGDGKTETAAPSDSNDIGGGKDVSRIVCTGDFVFLKRSDPDAPADENQIAMSEKADYDAEKEILVMTGKPVMMQGTNRLYGSRIKVYLKEDNRMEVETAKAQLAGKLLSSDDDPDATGLAVTAITAKKADIRQNEKITLSQNVVVDDGSGQITCGKMEIFMRKDSSNPLFDISGQTDRDTDDKKGKNELGNDVSKIICTGDVVYRKTTAGESGAKQVVLAREAHYDTSTEEIEMIGAHSSPQGEIPRETYDEIIRSIGKNGAAGSTEPYSIMMQDSNWVAGSPIKIFPKEGNRINIKYMKAGLRQNSRSTASKEDEL